MTTNQVHTQGVQAMTTNQTTVNGLNPLNMAMNVTNNQGVQPMNTQSNPMDDAAILASLYAEANTTAKVSTTDSVADIVSNNANNLDGTLGEFEAKLNQARLDKFGLTLKDVTDVVSCVAAMFYIERLGGRGLEPLTSKTDPAVLSRVIFARLITKVGYFFNNVKANDQDGGTTYNRMQRVQIVVEEMFGTDSSEYILIEKLIDYVIGFKLETTDGMINLCTKDGVVLHEDVVPTNLDIQIRQSGVFFVVKRGTKVSLSRGDAYIFNRGESITLGSDVLTTDLVKVMKTVNIHKNSIVSKNISGKKIDVVEYEEKTNIFKKRDTFFLLLALKANNIDFKPLLKAHKQGRDLRLVIARDVTKEFVRGSLKVVAYPAIEVSGLYLHSGPVSSKEASTGYVGGDLNRLNGDQSLMIEFVSYENGRRVITREAPNKTQSRLDKLNSAKALWKRKTKLFVINSLTHPSQAALNLQLVGSPILVPRSVVESDGICRYVSNMAQGGVKATSMPLSFFNKELYEGDFCVVPPTGFKGGLLSLYNLLSDNKVEDLKGLANISEETYETLVAAFKEEMSSKLTHIKLGGVPVLGYFVEVELECTNAYTIDTFRVVEQDEIDYDLTTKVGYEEAVSDLKTSTKARISKMMFEVQAEEVRFNGLRNIIIKAREEAEAKGDVFSLANFLTTEIKLGRIKRKNLITNVSSAELQTVAMYYGKDTASAWLKELLVNQQEYGFSQEKLYALEYLDALDRNVVITTSVHKILAILKSDERSSITKENSHYSKDVAKQLLELFSSDDHGWANITYNNGEVVQLPLGSVLVHDLEKQINDNKKRSVFTTGLLNELLENIKADLNESEVFFPDSKAHIKMDLEIQKQLLGKSLGYHRAKGFYGVALPLVRKAATGLATAGITNIERMFGNTEGRLVQATLTKFPTFFEGMMGTYSVFDIDMGATLNLLMECVVFVNPELVMMHQNDFDGDMYRLTVGSALPTVERLYDRFNGQYFADFLKGELEGNVIKLAKAQIATIYEYHEAIKASAEAADNVGLFTANSYYYELALSNLVGKTVFGTLKKEDITVTQKDAYLITSLFKMLIQIEAMDNMKMEGSNVFITDLLLHYKLRGISDFGTSTKAEIVRTQLGKAFRALTSLAKTRNLDLDEATIVRTLEVIYAAATVVEDHNEYLTLMVHNARAVGQKAQDELMESVRQPTIDYLGKFMFKDAYQDIVKGPDFESMHLESLVQTVDAIEEASLNNTLKLV